jgi:hypothetical protein
MVIIVLMGLIKIKMVILTLLVLIEEEPYGHYNPSGTNNAS